MFNFSKRPENYEFKGVLAYNLDLEANKWEEFAVPFLWKKVVEGGLRLRNRETSAFLKAIN